MFKSAACRGRMYISGSNPDPWFWWALLPLAFHTTLCLWAPLGHFNIKAPTDFVPPSLVERGPLFFTHCAPLTAYVNNVRHYLAPHCGGQSYRQSYRTTRTDLCHHTNLSTISSKWFSGTAILDEVQMTDLSGLSRQIWPLHVKQHHSTYLWSTISALRPSHGDEVFKI